MTLTTLFSKKNIKFKVALAAPGPEADGHFGFKPWSPSREIRHAELDALCIGGHVSSALEASDMVTSADSSGVHET